jgi:hypothetical protein
VAVTVGTGYQLVAHSGLMIGRESEYAHKSLTEDGYGSGTVEFASLAPKML